MLNNKYHNKISIERIENFSWRLNLYVQKLHNLPNYQTKIIFSRAIIMKITGMITESN